ncbi:class I SAM-dependent methyltransferase [Roseiconus lacunae]|uniref:class I SAM-dependent methyltransferase n=1 Tax=Roseiconus lacunae TaxID=2605694 RepID=UPI001F3CFA66|nr:rRNA adenine N-6-methyltransferase family protein [Roseiconus lacunae]WRQ51048.1 rRNA adenine N-6-methyltransferase family protein [Stieleria sp. HD01]
MTSTVEAITPPRARRWTRRFRVTQPSFAQRTWCVLRAWLQNPREVATVIPSSAQLMDCLANRQCIREAQTVIELGPGAGGTSANLLQQMPAKSRLLAIEKTEVFADALSEIPDSRFAYEIGDALNLKAIAHRHGIHRCDVVVSGIPFSNLPADVARQITQQIYELLDNTGVFLAYQVRDDVAKVAHPLFGTPRKQHVARNLPPLRVYSWTKVESGRGKGWQRRIDSA